ncbi:amino acid ABC transporter permease [Shumkonia mesophila]|uniref:amino acid ABC transporter permease n=1 Tax=Shumkonia mesophila TaxID=2838854 RepID=UPI0029344FC1|nr:amino acid ABC transporter permease [Shumkonia mesophila]
MEFTQFLNELWIARGALWQGFQLTVAVSALAVAFGTVLGLFVGMMLVYAWAPFKLLVRLYVDFIRGTPVFVLVLASFYILSVIGIQLNAFQAGVLAITVFCSSHVGEMVRGALQAIHRGQTEAAMAIGLTFRQTFQYVLMPQALRQILPTWVNAATEMVKASTLLSVIGVAELLLSTQQVISRNFLSLEFYFFAGLIYFAIDFSIERFGRYLERRLAAY